MATSGASLQRNSGHAVGQRLECEAGTTPPELTERERVRDLYSAVVVGARYGTKTPPGQQPMNPCTGDMTRGLYLHNFQVWSLRYTAWFGM